MFLTFVLALLAAVGLLSLCCWILQAFRYRLRQENCFHVVHLYGDAPEVEQIIKCCLRLRNEGAMAGKLVFVDEGLSPEGQIAGELLLRKQENAVLCSPAQVGQMIKWEREEIGAGTHQR